MQTILTIAAFCGAVLLFYGVAFFVCCRARR